MKNYLLNLVALMLLLAGCGGGGGSNSAPLAATGGASGSSGAGNSASNQGDPGSDLISGRITGFGSVFIDGNRFDTSSASFSKDDDAATQSDLKVGMVVEVRGDLASGIARSVDFEEDIKGPVDSIGSNELTVLGQTVLIVADTVIDDSLNLAALNVGDVLEISGLRGANDVLEASFIEDKTPQNVNAYKVIGQIRDHNEGARTFRIGGLLIDYNAARLDDGVTIANGQTVEVKDENRAYNPGDLTLMPTKIEPAGLGWVSGDESDQSSTDGVSATSRIRVEGLVSEVLSATQFSIGGTTVNHSGSTTFVFGDASALSVGTKVQIEGSRASDNTITATKIKFARNSARVEGVVENVNFDTGEMSILGLTINSNGASRFEDKRDDVEPFGVTDIMVGDFLAIRGNSIGNILNAHEIEREESDDTRLRGPAADIDRDARTLTILGLPITTDSNTQYEGFNDEVITAGTFFDALSDGQTLVDAQWNGTVTDTSVAVRELSLED
jgi:hypothetical protein